MNNLWRIFNWKWGLPQTRFGARPANFSRPVRHMCKYAGISISLEYLTGSTTQAIVNLMPQDRLGPNALCLLKGRNQICTYIYTYIYIHIYIYAHIYIYTHIYTFCKDNGYTPNFRSKKLPSQSKCPETEVMPCVWINSRSTSGLTAAWPAALHAPHHRDECVSSFALPRRTDCLFHPPERWWPPQRENLHEDILHFNFNAYVVFGRRGWRHP